MLASFKPLVKSTPLLVRRLSTGTPVSQKLELTFFTKATCMLCTNARGVLLDTLKDDSMKDKDLNLKIVDIMKPENSEAFDAYCFDVPVLHVDRSNQTKPVKFMHYFYNEKLLEEFNKE